MTSSNDIYRAFERRAEGVGATCPVIGTFGDVPRPLIASTGALAVDVKAPPLADAFAGPLIADVSRVIEPFMDEFAARFLHRLAAGSLDHLAAVVFARDDVVALAAYQYATELRRQGIMSADGPRLHLWNLLHTDSAPAHLFNRTELARLDALLADLGCTRSDAAWQTALALESQRLAALARGSYDFVAHNAGYWMDASAHLTALEKADRTSNQGPRIGIIGTDCDVATMWDIANMFGHVTVDIQTYGTQPHPTGKTPEAFIRDVAMNPLHIRANPPGRFRPAMLTALTDCDVVLSSVSPHDDGFGWDVPALRDALTGQGKVFVDLGFRPFRPDAEWMATATRKIEETLG